MWECLLWGCNFRAQSGHQLTDPITDSKNLDRGVFIASKGELCKFQTRPECLLAPLTCHAGPLLIQSAPPASLIFACPICSRDGIKGSVHIRAGSPPRAPSQYTDEETEAQKGKLLTSEGSWGGTVNLGAGGLCLCTGLSCGILDKLPNLSVLSFLLCKMGLRIKSPSQCGCENQVSSEPGTLWAIYLALTHVHSPQGLDQRRSSVPEE